MIVWLTQSLCSKFQRSHCFNYNTLSFTGLILVPRLSMSLSVLNQRFSLSVELASCLQIHSLTVLHDHSLSSLRCIYPNISPYNQSQTHLLYLSTAVAEVNDEIIWNALRYDYAPRYLWLTTSPLDSWLDSRCYLTGCSEVMCMMYCDFGFETDPITGCPTCDCLNPCEVNWRYYLLLYCLSCFQTRRFSTVRYYRLQCLGISTFSGRKSSDA